MLALHNESFYVYCLASGHVLQMLIVPDRTVVAILSELKIVYTDAHILLAARSADRTRKHCRKLTLWRESSTGMVRSGSL